MSYYAVFDTNVLVSSLLAKRKDSPTAMVVDAIAAGDLIPLYNQEILDEYDEVLHRAKFPFSENSIRRILIMIRENGMEIFPYPTGEILPDMDDLVFYEVVMDKRSDDDYLITGNIKHFPKREYIVTPAEMMALIEANR